jgi:hypothetical protein
MMKRYAFHATVAFSFLLVACASALETDNIIADPAAKELLAKKCIRASTAGVVQIPFEKLSAAMARPDLIPAAQREYARSVASDGKIKFPVVADAKGCYHYINEKGQRTDIIELARKQNGLDSLDIVLIAGGKRFFGKYEAIIHVRFSNADTAGSIYAAEVHAYPHNPAWRFLVRRLGMIERFFKKKTSVIEDIVKAVGLGLSRDLDTMPDMQPKHMGMSSNMNVYIPHRH